MERDSSEIHINWASAFLADSRKSANDEDRDRYYACAVENAVAVVEAARECARDKSAKRKIEEEAKRILPHYLVLKDVRAHNFHRRVIPSLRNSMTMLGPVKFSAMTPGSSVEMTITARGAHYTQKGKVKIDETNGGKARAVTVKGYDIWDPYGGVWIRRDLAVETYLVKCSEFLASVRPHLER